MSAIPRGFVTSYCASSSAARDNHKAKDISRLFSLLHHYLEETDGVDAGEGGVEGGRSVVAPDDGVVLVTEDAPLTSSARTTAALKK